MACKFCSAATIKDDLLTVDEIVNEVKNLKPSTIILLGGEALLRGPEFYYDLLSKVSCRLDFTTNLKEFYRDPDPWVDLFKNPRVGVCTSFNYGNTRMWDSKTIYDENMFRKVMSLFNSKIGYTPMFIAVIDYKNMHLWRKHIELAKELGTVCRLNGTVSIGKSASSYFPRYEMFKIWIQCVKEGLDKYEVNSSERHIGRCPFNTGDNSCIDNIRVIEKINGQIVYSYCDDMNNRKCWYTKQENVTDKIEPLSSDCYSCELFRLCNGCRSNWLDIQAAKDTNWCREMLSLKDILIEQGWKL